MTHGLIAVGDVMLDGSLPEPVPGRRTHGHIELRAGGSAVNAALTAAGLGARAAVVGRVGNDAAGRLVAETLAGAGVEPLLAFDEDAATGCVVVAGTGTVADPGASARLSPGDLPPSLQAGAVLVSGYSLLLPGSEAGARAALAQAETALLAVDAASAGLVVGFGVERFFEATAGVDVLLANDDEARALTGLEADDAVRALGERYSVACVKLGPQGAVAAARGAVGHAPAQKFDQAGALGAGDAFAAGFLLALRGGLALAEAVARGCGAAARWSTRSGFDA